MNHKKLFSYLCSPVLLSMRMNVDSKKTSVRGIRKSPGGSLKVPKVCVFTSSAFESLALEAGADHIANEKTYEDITSGADFDYEICIATSDVMSQVKNLGRYLGPKGLMPNPKLGTSVSPDKLEESIKSFKAGSKEFRMNNNSLIHLALGKTSFEDNDLLMNLDSFLRELDFLGIENKTFKQTVKSVHLSSRAFKGSYKLKFETIDPSNDEYFTN
eukprot:CAMPEP_0170519042 /NCGR_PEP_ID=MMETSP0209-20121228/4595_1 /TAXON_ID=665100 ORGANISM="Litonotus pictus, Strain P1" /NCGR_SAMPLE_ID=MMETSP0209 /ASSEMBLY_ACC=CAM_ASM_000301 /LENGTH=214 /DNA_ID=CAMNT_0010804829 /DNA_START=294 /DNA_END=938 /DNA_ORIENTATION=+